MHAVWLHHGLTDLRLVCLLLRTLIFDLMRTLVQLHETYTFSFQWFCNVFRSGLRLTKTAELGDPKGIAQVCNFALPLGSHLSVPDACSSR
jgi:hypothetical protein